MGPGQTISCDSPSVLASSSLSSSASLAELDAINQQAIQFYQELGERARRCNLITSLFCTGPANFNVNILRHVSSASGGSIFMHKSFSSAFASDLKNIVHRHIGYHGVLDVYYSSSLSLARVIGNVTTMEDDDEQLLRGDEDEEDEEQVGGYHEAEGDEESQERRKQNGAGRRGRREHGGGDVNRRVAHSRLSLSSLRGDQSVALYWQLDDDFLAGDFLHFQFVLRYTNLYDERVVRVSTRRLRITGNRDTYLASIDVQMIGLLLTKKYIVHAMHEQLHSSSSFQQLQQAHDKSIEKVRNEVEADVAKVFENFGCVEYEPLHTEDLLEEQLDRKVVGYSVPVQLADLPLMLYQCRYGPLVGSVNQNEDDSYIVRSLFVQATRSDAHRILVPLMHSFNTNGDVHIVPTQTLAMQSDKILFLDNHTTIIVWSGREVCGPTFNFYRDACRSKAESLSRRRLPYPEVIVCSEGTSAARQLSARLIPSHQDERDMQLEEFPLLRALTPSQHQALLKKLLPTDEPSFHQFCNDIILKVHHHMKEAEPEHFR